MPAHKDSVYIMGTTDEEYERLRRQARMFERFAVAAFDRIQLGQAMSCLDVGCSPGEVMRLMAERVGPSACGRGNPTVLLSGCRVAGAEPA